MENINFELYRVFIEVAKYGNLTKAATELFISQPAVTQSIKRLEKQIGYKLFYRTKSGMKLTDNGKELFDFLHYPVECLNASKKRLEEINIKKDSIIRIGSSTNLIKNSLINPVKKFKDEHPDILIEIRHGIAYEVMEMMDNNLLDIAIMRLPYKMSDNVVIEVIDEIEDGFIASSKEFEEYKNKKYSMEKLNNLPLILQSKLTSSRKILDELCVKNHVTLVPTYELDSYSLVHDFVKNGLGIGCLNKNSIKKQLKNGDLFELDVDFAIPSRQVGAIINKRVMERESIKKFLEVLKSK